MSENAKPKPVELVNIPSADPFTTVCIWNWEKDESLGFPAAVRIGRKKLRNLDEVDAWLRARTVRRVVREKPEEVATI
jgi:hypothetical protein